MQNENPAIRFQTGALYFSRSIADHECIIRVQVIRRTAKSVWVEDWKDYSNVVRRSIKIREDYNGRPIETFADSSWRFSADKTTDERALNLISGYKVSETETTRTVTFND